MVEAELPEVAPDGKLNLSGKKRSDKVCYYLSGESKHIKHYKRHKICNEYAVFKVVQCIFLKKRNNYISCRTQKSAGYHNYHPCSVFVKKFRYLRQTEEGKRDVLLFIVYFLIVHTVSSAPFVCISYICL